MTTIRTQLPRDLVEEEILSRIPATSLKRLRSTCKRWNRLFKRDLRFARNHSDKSLKEFLVLILTHQFRICPMKLNLHGVTPSVEVKGELSLTDPHSNNSDQFDICEVFHCDGFLLCTDMSRLVVWNPITGQTRWIKGCRNENYSYVLGYCQDKESCVKRYKLLSYDCDGNNKYKPQIYDFSSDSWRILDHDIIDPGWRITPFSLKVSLKGNAYLFAKNEKNCISLLRFDFATEKSSGHVPLPYQCSRFQTLNISVVREEKISVLLQRNRTSKTEVWVTNKIDETKEVLWSKVLALDLSFDLQISREGRFLIDEEKKVVVCCERWIDPEDNDTVSKDMVYIVGEDNNVIQVDVGGDSSTIYGCWPLILNYVPSLVQIERARGNKRRRGD
ncbi:hypothetical protein AALP_AA3G178600 [Arabis alpina]|uniref:F-box domain-containing protein n=1 Tax=Arabis alpina TaxID=50452 RepID=A0A087H9X7_ARAAL|nr:hypothetical protein AALP_AA3G178600 [Arabis alpina]